MFDCNASIRLSVGRPRCEAALVALMRTLEKSVDARPLVNKAKHFAFARCAEANLLGLVDTQAAVIEAELLAGTLV